MLNLSIVIGYTVLFNPFIRRGIRSFEWRKIRDFNVNT